MNKHIVIGNLVRDPELRHTQSGLPVCSFTVAVNRRLRGGESAVDYIDVTAWDNLGEVCAKWLSKGKKVMVCGRPGARAWIGRDGGARAALELTADEVEFLTPRSTEAPAATDSDPGEDFTEVDDGEIPF